MSKTRAVLRAERQAAAARRSAAEQAARRKAATGRERHERQALAWRRVRLWHNGPGAARHKDVWAALGTLVMVVLLSTYLFTSSLRAVLLVLLVFVIAGPVLVKLSFDRSRK